MLKTSRFPVLDGWRAIAIGLVIWHHATMSRYVNEDLYWATSKSQLGAFGVDIFFGISGLLITRLLVLEYQREGTINLTAFYTRRVFRILPPCFALLAVVGCLGLFQTRLELISCLGFFRNYIRETLGGTYTRHLWSLAVEEHFYLFWPALVVWLTTRDLSGRAVAYISIFFGLWRVYDAQTGTTARLLPGVNTHFRTDLRADALLWGCYVAFLLAAPGATERLRKHLNAPVIAIATAAALACVLFYSMLAMLWFAMLVPVILAGTMLHPEWRFCRVLEVSPIRFMGRISYSLYLWQAMFLLPGWLPKIGFLQQWPWNLVATFGAATASYFLLEKPCMQFGRLVAQRAGRVLKPQFATIS